MKLFEGPYNPGGTATCEIIRRSSLEAQTKVEFDKAKGDGGFARRENHAPLFVG